MESYMTVSTTHGWVEQAVHDLRCFIHLQLNHGLNCELNPFILAKCMEKWPHFDGFQRASHGFTFQL